MLFSIKKSEWLGNERNDLFAGLVSLSPFYQK